jgi:pyruvate/2-oxoglutarate dehydrogenase complex dihydrolipoamide dehydrogenase (E3) component
MRHRDSFGLCAMEPEIEFLAVIDHVRGLRDALAPHDSPERLRRAGVDVIIAHGRFAGPGRIAADGRHPRYRTAVIATGSRLTVPDIPGLDAGQALTTDAARELSESPQRLVILGGGPTGCELGQAFARLGARVTIVESAERLLGGEEPRASDLVATTLRSEGIDVDCKPWCRASVPGSRRDPRTGRARNTNAADRHWLD